MCAILLNQCISLPLKLLSDGYLLAQSLPRRLIPLEDIAVPDGVPASLHQALSSDALQPLDHQLLVHVVLAGAGCQTPLLPLVELLGDALRPLLLACVAEGEKDALLEGQLRHQGTQSLVTGGKLLTLDGGQPFDEGVTLLSPVVPAKHREEGLGLSLSELHEISPSAEFVPNVQILSAADKFADLDHCMTLGLCDLLLSQVGSPPGIVKADLSPLGNVEIDEIKFFVILMREIHRLAVPETKEETLGLLVVVREDPHETVDYSFHSLKLD